MIMISSSLRFLFKNKRWILIYLVPALISVASGRMYAGPTEEPYKLRKIVIDPGHGGKDPGAIGQKSVEKDIVLAISLKLGKYIEENHKDVEVIYTRKKDEHVELFRRADIANENNADLFISIHANGHASNRAFGTETFAMGLHTSKENLEVARKENRAILYEDDYETRYEGYDPDSPESFIVFSLMQNTFLKQSLDFASHIQSQFRERVKRYDRGVKQAGFLVLYRTTMPSVLIEVGFITNPEEERFLMSEEGQNYLASAVYRAFREYKNSIEEKSAILVNGSNYLNGEKPLAVSENHDLPENQAVQNNQVVFMVQVSASSSKIDPDSDFFGEHGPATEFFSDGIYKYTVGQAKNLSEASELRKKVNKSFPDAFLVASINGKLISVQEARKLLNP